MNFWDLLLTGMSDLVTASVLQFPYHTPMGTVRMLEEFFEAGMGMNTAWLLNLFDLGVPVLMLGFMTAMEVVRAIYAIYIWVKELWPFS